jgi:hypothetical protein
MELFDIIKRIFDKKPLLWNEISKNDKVRNFFMVNRIMAIQFPVQANQFNKLKVTPNQVVDWWHDTLSSKFTRAPGWVYTRTEKSSAKKNDKSGNDKNFEEVEAFISQKFKISMRDLKQLKIFYPDKYIDWMESVSKQVGVKIK